MKRWWWLLVVTFLTILTASDYLKSGFPYTHDGENHLARFANYKLAVRELQIPPRFAPNLMNHYGYPVFNYNYPLANILSLPFSVLDIHYEVTFKVLVFASLITGGLGVVAWIRSLFPAINRLAVIFAVAVWYSSPYLTNLLLYRGNIGELFVYCLLPWVFWSVELTRRKSFSVHNVRWWWALTTWTALLLSHNIAALIGISLALVLALLRIKLSMKGWKRLGAFILLATLATLWFWLPAVAETHLVIIKNSQNQSAYMSHFPSLTQLLFAPLQFGFSYPGNIDSLSYNLGFVQIVIFFQSCVVLVKNYKKLSDSGYFYLLLGAAGLCLILSVLQLSGTSFAWSSIPGLRFIQFPWRLSLFIGVLLLPLASHAFSHVTHKWRYVLCFLLCIQIITIFSQKPVDYFHRGDAEYDNFPQSTTTQNENLPQSFRYIDIGDWQPTPIFLEGRGVISVLHWTGSNRRYELTVDERATIVEPTMVYAGWETTVSEIGSSAKPDKAKYVDSDTIQGRLAYTLPAGRYQVVSRFTQHTWPRVLGNAASVLTAMGLVLYGLVHHIIRYNTARHESKTS